MHTRITFGGAVLAAALALGGCSSWDDVTVSGTAAGGQLREQVADATAVTDPRTLTGVSVVTGMSEVEPVAGTVSPQLPVELTDADGREVVVTDTSRILALDLYGTYTRTLRGLGLGENIIGRTVSSSEPSLQSLPVVTESGHSINVEAVLNLRPSLVIVDHSVGPREAIDQIRSAGVTVVVMAPERSLDSIATDITDLAAVVGLPGEGEKLAQRSLAELAADRAAVADLVPDEPLRMAFLYARGDGGVFFVLGEESGSRGLIEGLGGIDVAAENGVGAPAPANAEALAELNPEVFVMMSGGLESTGDLAGLLARPGVAQTVAGQHQRVLALPDGQALSFGPQTGELLLRGAQALYLQEGQ